MGEGLFLFCANNGLLVRSIRTSWITPHHFIRRELSSVIITYPITPNNFWRFNKCNSQEQIHLLVLSLLGRSLPPITPKYSQRIGWRNRFHLCYTRKFSGNLLCNPTGPFSTKTRILGMMRCPNMLHGGGGDFGFVGGRGKCRFYFMPRGPGEAS